MIEPSQQRRAQSLATPADATAHYRTPHAARYDLIIIGGGSAGLPAAGLAAMLGARVALLDRERLGGECLHTGCVPSKALLRVARLVADVRAAAAFGLTARIEPVNLAAVADRVQQAIAEVYAESDAPELYVAMGVDVVFGDPHFVSPKALSINGHTISARRYLICTGSHPAIPDTAGLAEAGFLTNESVFDVRTLPPRLAVIGGGPIGVELGQAFARLGAHVTIVQHNARILPKDAADAAAVLHTRLVAEGIDVRTRAEIEEVTVRGGAKVLRIRTPDGTAEVVVDEILVATGRAPTVAGLNLDPAGVRFDARAGIAVSAHLRTSNPRIYAAGDVIGSYNFTHAAARQSLAAVRNALFPRFLRSKLDQRVMPWATFTEPEVAKVGLSLEEARTRHGNDTVVVTQPFHAVDRAITDGETEGFIRLVAEPNGKLLGAQIVGAGAGELINELALALEQRLSLAQLAGTTHVYPTLSLGIQQAAAQFALARTARSPLVRRLARVSR